LIAWRSGNQSALELRPVAVTRPPSASPALVQQTLQFVHDRTDESRRIGTTVRMN
jgi:hypothetical protein